MWTPEVKGAERYIGEFRGFKAKRMITDGKNVYIFIKFQYFDWIRDDVEQGTNFE